MFNRFGKWWSLWMALIVLWTAVAFAFTWTNLPRAQSLPHDPQFLNRLSENSSSILRSVETTKKPVRGALMWSNSPRFVRMSNGADLTFPFSTSGEQVAFVANEYRQLLHEEARGRRWSYLPEMLALWLLPCGGLLAAALAARPMQSASAPFRSRAQVIPHYVRQRADHTTAEGDTVINARAVASPVAEGAAEDIEFSCAA